LTRFGSKLLLSFRVPRFDDLSTHFFIFILCNNRNYVWWSVSSHQTLALTYILESLRIT
jgi:hypothetical protein